MSYIAEHSCGNCKHLRHNPDRLCPFGCRKNQGVTYSAEVLWQRMETGYTCEKYEEGKMVNIYG